MQIIRLVNAGVNSVPPDVSRLTGLSALSILAAIQDEPLQLHLPDELSLCKKLVALHLSCDKMPSCVVKLAGLAKLTVDQCGLSEEDTAAFSKLTALRMLRVCNQHYQNVDRETFHRALQQLKVMTLSRNLLGGPSATVGLPCWMTQVVISPM